MLRFWKWTKEMRPGFFAWFADWMPIFSAVYPVASLVSRVFLALLLSLLWEEGGIDNRVGWRVGLSPQSWVYNILILVRTFIDVNPTAIYIWLSSSLFSHIVIQAYRYQLGFFFFFYWNSYFASVSYSAHLK